MTVAAQYIHHMLIADRSYVCRHKRYVPDNVADKDVGSLVHTVVYYSGRNHYDAVVAAEAWQTAGRGGKAKVSTTC